jgi:hypothetical protein
MLRIQPTGMAHARVVLPDNSAATFERCDICHSIKHCSLPLIRKPHPPGVPTTSEALARAGETAGALSHNDEVPESADRVRVVGS